jgi:hypothetical protein
MLIKVPKKAAEYLALAGLGAACVAGSLYIDYNRHLDNELRYARASVIKVPNVDSAGWHNFVNEGGGTADDWALHQYKLKELNGGKDITKLRPSEPILLFDLPDPETGKPDGKVLPGSYGK